MRLRLSILAMISAMAASSASATVYGIKSNAVSFGGGSSAPARLFSFEENGSSFSDLGAINIGGSAIDADALAMSQTFGMLAFQTSIGGSRLISLGSGSPLATIVGGLLSGRDIRGAAFDLNNRLWAVDAASDELLQINPLTGGIVGGPIGLTIDNLPAALELNGVDLAVQLDGTVMLVNYHTGYNLDLLSGALTQVFDHPFPSYVELGFAPPFYTGAAFSVDGAVGDLYLYEANGTEEIYSASGADFLSRTTLFTNIIPSFNAGRGDLASLMPVATVPAPGALALLGLGLLGLRVMRRGFLNNAVR